jgi:cytochrome c-type biogenesis protein CcmF
VIQSVHSFGESPIGTFFLVFLAVIAVVSAVVLWLRWDLLKGERAFEELLSREGFFLAGNVILVVMTVVTLVGTIWPVLSGLGGKPVTVNGQFYNKVVLPMGLVLAALMSTGPVLGHGVGAIVRAKNKLMGMGMVGIGVGAMVWLMGWTSVWAVAAGAIVATVAAGIMIDVVTTVRAKGGEGAGRMVKLATARPRHWGAQLAHLGIAAIIVGVAGSAVYGTNQNVELKQGMKGKAAGYTLELKGFEKVRRANHTAIVATVDVTDGNGMHVVLAPERRFYDRGVEEGMSASEVSLQMGLGKDVYMTLAGWEDNGASVVVTAIVNPLVSWIWIGGCLLALGGAICIVPERKREVPVAVAAPKPLQTGHTARERRRAVTGITPAIANGRR